MSRRIPAVCAVLAVLLSAVPGHASAPGPAALQAADPLPSLFVDFFYRWKSAPQNLQVSDLKVLDTGGGLRVLCGTYALPGQALRPFLVLGDATPSASAAWEPGSFPQSDPLYPQLMDNLRVCQTLGVVVTASSSGKKPSCTAVGYCSEVCPKHVDPANAVNQNKVESAKDYFLRFLRPRGGER